SVDWKGRRAWAEPTESARSTRWNGGARGIGFEIAQCAKQLLAGEGTLSRLSLRATDALESLRQEYDFVPAGSGTVVTVENGQLKWWTFGGLAANRALMGGLRHRGVEVRSVDDLSLSLSAETRRGELERCVGSLKADAASCDVGEDVLESIKFS